jgi:hypothetical protein
MSKPKRYPKVEVEPLGEASWQRIERNVMQALEREGRPLREARELGEALGPARPASRASLRFAYGFVLTGAAAAVLAMLSGRLLERPRPADALERVVTHESATHVAYGEATLDVAANSALVVSGDDERGVLVVLDRGQVTCEVAPRRGRPPFLVQAGDVRIRVIGTKFSVRRDGDAAAVVVDHGVVEISERGQVARVSAGEIWPRPTPPAAPAPSMIKTAREPPEPMAPPSAPQPVATVPSKHALHRPHLKHGKHTTAVRAPAAPAPRAPLPVEPEPPAPPVVPAPARPAPPPPAVSAQERYEAAARFEARDPEGALGIYRSLSTGSDNWAANALYAQGRLQADRGRLREARALLRSYLERFPAGHNADDARHLLNRLR